MEVNDPTSNSETVADEKREMDSNLLEVNDPTNSSETCEDDKIQIPMDWCQWKNLKLYNNCLLYLHLMKIMKISKLTYFYQTNRNKPKLTEINQN